MDYASQPNDREIAAELDLKVELSRLGLRQSELAKLLGVSARAVGMWAAGDVCVPGPVAGYLRLMGLLSSEQLGLELKRLPGREKAFEPGMYRLEYQAQVVGGRDTGQVFCVLCNGKIFGTDPWGGVLYGRYEFNPGSKKTRVEVAFKVPPGFTLASGDRIGQERGAVEISALFARPEPCSTAVIKVGGVPVDVVLAYLGPLPK